MAPLQVGFGVGVDYKTKYSAGSVTPVVETVDHFFDQSANTLSYSATVYPGAFYVPSMNSIVVATFRHKITGASITNIKPETNGGSPPIKQGLVLALDLNTNSWYTGGETAVDNSDQASDSPISESAADNHGEQGGIVDWQNYIHFFGYCHSDHSMVHVSSTSPSDVSSFTTRSSIFGAGVNRTYAHPVVMGQKVFLAYRFLSDSFAAYITSGTMLNGDVDASGWEISPGVQQKRLFGFGTDGGTYFGPTAVNGNEIAYTCTELRGEGGAGTTRYDTYCVVFNTVTGKVRNLANTVSAFIGATAPSSEADMLPYKVSSSMGLNTITPVMAQDANNNLHWAVTRGPTNDVAELYHFAYDWNGNVVVAETKIADIADCLTAPAIYPTSTGIEVVYGKLSAVTHYVSPLMPNARFNRSGDAYRRAWTPGGSWAPEALLRAATRAYGFGDFMPVKDAPAGAPRVIVPERTPYVDYESGGDLRSYAYKEGGVLVPRAYQPEAETTVWAARLATPVSKALEKRVDGLLKTLKDAGGGTLLQDGIYIAYGVSQEDSKKNLVSTSNDLTFGANVITTGGVFDGQSLSKVDTGYGLLATPGKFKYNLHHVAYWSMTDAVQTVAGSADAGQVTKTTSKFQFEPRAAGDIATLRDYSAGNFTASGVASTLGFFSLCRNSSVSSGAMFRRATTVTDATTGNQTNIYAGSTITAAATVFATEDNLSFLGSGTAYSARKLAVMMFGGAAGHYPSIRFANAMRRWVIDSQLVP